MAKGAAPKGGRYRCPRCGNTVQVMVPIKYAPACANDKHGRKPVTMEEIK